MSVTRQPTQFSPKLWASCLSVDRGSAKGRVAVAAAIAKRELAVASGDVFLEGVWRQVADDMAASAFRLADETKSAADRLQTFQFEINGGLRSAGKLIGPAFGDDNDGERTVYRHRLCLRRKPRRFGAGCRCVVRKQRCCIPMPISSRKVDLGIGELGQTYEEK